MRPIIYNYNDPIDFIRDTINFRKKTEASFSVLNITKKLRRLSPALVSLILKGKRRLTLDRAEEMAILCGLKRRERQYFIQWIDQLDPQKNPLPNPETVKPSIFKRKHASPNLLKNWLNVYVKDSVRMAQGTDQKREILRILGGIANSKKIEKSLDFLLREGYLRIDQDGRYVEDSPLVTTGDGQTHAYIRKFHKKALQIAEEAIESYDTSERYANSIVLPLNKKSYQELLELFKEFAEKLKIFCESHEHDDERLYQIILNISPTGGKND